MLATARDVSNYPHIFPPPGFIPFVRANSITVSANATNTVGTGSQVLIPVQMEGWLSLLGVQIGSSTGSWTLQQSGQGMRDFTSINTSLGNVQTPVKVYQKLFPSQQIQLVFSNTGGSAMAASFLMVGWYYPKS